jgi:anaerobic ribonucleoside-triphosphate reductase activating protein
MSPRWRIHAVVPRSRANGPGARFTIWFQGCTLGCPGCFNPGTHDPVGPGEAPDVTELVDAALAEQPAIEGVTLSGGEPLQQPVAVAAFCEELRARSGLGIIVLTGFARREIEADPLRLAAVAHADMVIAGRYRARRYLGTGLRGSDNKEYWARTNRYSPSDLASVPDLEIAVGVDGGLVVTGMPEHGVVPA